MSKEQSIPFEGILKRLSILDKAPEVGDYIRENEEYLTQVIVDGFNQLIDRFNSLIDDPHLLTIMPKSKDLITALNGESLPSLEEISPRELVLGIHDARDPMIKGQQIKHNKLEKTPENIQFAIGTPSMETGNGALTIGTGGHIIERSILRYLRNREIISIEGREWQKDDILFALEECALLLRAEYEHEDGEEPILFDVITTPNAEMGLGWKTRESADAFLEEYEELMYS